MAVKRSFLKTALIALFLVFGAAACGSDGFPEAYDETVEENYMNGCRVALEDASAQVAEAMDGICGCAYGRITAEIPFEDFEALNGRLRDDLTILANPEGDTVAIQAVEILADCITSS